MRCSFSAGFYLQIVVWSSRGTAWVFIYLQFQTEVCFWCSSTFSHLWLNVDRSYCKSVWKCIGNVLLGIRRYPVQLTARPTPTLSATYNTQRMDVIMMPRAHYTAKNYDWLKIACNVTITWTMLIQQTHSHWLNVVCSSKRRHLKIKSWDHPSSAHWPSNSDTNREVWTIIHYSMIIIHYYVASLIVDSSFRLPSSQFLTIYFYGTICMVMMMMTMIMIMIMIMKTMIIKN